MTSSGPSESNALDLGRDLPTTPDDVRVLRKLRACAASWFDLTPEEIDALLPEAALDRRAIARSEWEPFPLE